MSDHEYQDYLDELKVIGEGQIEAHRLILADSREKISNLAERFSFHECLQEILDILIVLEVSRDYRLDKKSKKLDNSQTIALEQADSPDTDRFFDHAHWKLVLDKTFEQLYPLASLTPDEPISKPFVPLNIAYDLMVRNLLDPSDPQKIQDHLNDVAVLKCFIADCSTTISNYLSAFEFNLFRLIAQKDEESENTPPPHHDVRRNTPAEIAIYYVASNIGVQRAIEYLEALWNDGWVHNVNIYAPLWLGLLMWLRNNPEENIYQAGRVKYTEEIIFFDRNASTTVDELLSAARDIMKRVRKSLNIDRARSLDLSSWLRAVPKYLLQLVAIIHLKRIAENKYAQDNIPTELTQIWRYAEETRMDISTLIGNPFGLPLGRMLRATASSRDLRNLEHNLRFYNSGRVAFPEVTHKQIVGTIREEIETGTTAERLEKALADLILSNFGKGFQEIYTTAFPLTREDRKKADQPQTPTWREDQDKDYQNLSPMSKIIASALVGFHGSYQVGPIPDVRLPFSVELDKNLQLYCPYENGSPLELGIIDKSEDNSHSLTAHAQEADQEQNGMNIELINTEKRVNLLVELLEALTYAELHSGLDKRALRHIFVDLASSTQVLFFDFEDGTPKALNIIPRKLLSDQETSVDELEAQTLGVSGMGLYAILQEKPELSFRGQLLNTVPIYCMLMKTDKGNLMMRIGNQDK